MRHPHFDLAVVAAHVVVALLATAYGSASLGYNRAAVDAGEWWRLLSASYVHTNGTHWALNASGLVLLLTLMSAPQRRLAVAALPVLGAGVFCIEHFVLSHQWACGLSGGLHALAVALLATKRPHWSVWVVGIGALVKIAQELTVGQHHATATLIGAPVLSLHHAAGAAIGLCWVAVIAVSRYTQQPTQPPSPPCAPRS